MHYQAECWFPSVIHFIGTELNQEIKSFCLQEYKRDPVGNSLTNRGGWQSQPMYHDNIITKFLYEVFDNTIHNTFKNRFAITNHWINVNQPTTYNVIHRHPNSVLSGVYYIQTPNNSGNIFFENPHMFESFLELNSYKEEEQGFFHQHSLKYCKPEEGLLILFPSHLAHGVQLNNSKEDRISISFNTQLSNE